MKDEVERYINAKKSKTACMQKHFKQVCSRCRFYVGCEVYSEYVEAWIQLQKGNKQNEKY